MKDPEVMSIPDAAAVLKVGHDGNGGIHISNPLVQAVEIGNPNSAYELSVLTHFVRGQAAHRGKVSLPRDPRTKAEVMLAFAQGRQAQAAVKAGAAYVGGVELIDDVRVPYLIYLLSSRLDLSPGIVWSNCSHKSALHSCTSAPYHAQTCTFSWPQRTDACRAARDCHR